MIYHLPVVLLLHRLLPIFGGGLLVEHEQEEERGEADEREEGVDHCPAEDGQDQVGHQEADEGGQGRPNEEQRVDLGAESRE